MAEKKKDIFWLSYSDLMTSLFFVMLVLFVLIFTVLNNHIEEMQKVNEELRKYKDTVEQYVEDLKAKAEELERIKEIEKTVSNIDKRYFKYDEQNKKHILNVQFLFPSGSADIEAITPDRKPELREAGVIIKNLIKKFPIEDNIKYLVVVEGQASKDNWSGNDDLSFHRAQSLVKYWRREGIGLEYLNNCELVIAGSGERGIPRTQPDEPPNNQRFLITIVPKIGEMKK